MIKLKENVYVNPGEIASIQHEELWTTVGSITDFIRKKYFDGSIVTLKCGRKISIPDVKPDQIAEKIKQTEGDGE
jgi:hypothetical protein